MHCIDHDLRLEQPLHRRRTLLGAGSLGGLLGTAWLFVGCGTRQPAPPAPAPAPAAPAPRPAPPPTAAAPAPTPPAAPPPATPAAPPTAGGRAPRYVQLGPPTPSRNWEELRIQAARRLVAAHPDTTFMGKPQQLLLAIPVIEVELNADGSIRAINVLRQPTQARDTVQLAIDAIRRAAPYGDVSRLPRPWKFVETFLFNDDRRFKPRTLDP